MAQGAGSKGRTGREIRTQDGCEPPWIRRLDIEAVIGLLIEIICIAMFTQRFFAT
jgi:hypothetical protein